MTDTVAVRMSGVHARDERGSLNGVDLALPVGSLGALVGTPSDGTTSMVRAIAGVLPVLRGSMLVSGQDPRGSPSVRQRIGTLIDDPTLPDLGSVRELVVFTRMVRGGEAPRDAWYDLCGLAALDTAKITTLTRPQRRTVALALALAVPSPSVLVLHEPCSDLFHVDIQSLRAILRDRAQQGACVLITTASMTDAASFADDVATLQRGRIDRAIGSPDPEALTPGSHVELQVWCDQPRVLAAALTLEPAIQAVSWRAGQDAPVSVRGLEAGECGAAIARAAASGGVRVEAIRPVIPSAGEVNAASAGLALAERTQAALHAARRQP